MSSIEQGTVRIEMPSPLEGEGIFAGRTNSAWVRGSLHTFDAETTPHPASLREATLSHTGRG